MARYDCLSNRIFLGLTAMAIALLCAATATDPTLALRHWLAWSGMTCLAAVPLGMIYVIATHKKREEAKDKAFYRRLFAGRN